MIRVRCSFEIAARRALETIKFGVALVAITIVVYSIAAAVNTARPCSLTEAQHHHAQM